MPYMSHLHSYLIFLEEFKMLADIHVYHGKAPHKYILILNLSIMFTLTKKSLDKIHVHSDFINSSNTKPLQIKQVNSNRLPVPSAAGLTEMYGANDVTGHTARVILMTPEVIHATVAMIDRLGRTHTYLFPWTCFKIGL